MGRCRTKKGMSIPLKVDRRIIGNTQFITRKFHVLALTHLPVISPDWRYIRWCERTEGRPYQPTFLLLDSQTGMFHRSRAVRSRKTMSSNSSSFSAMSSASSRMTSQPFSCRSKSFCLSRRYASGSFKCWRPSISMTTRAFRQAKHTFMSGRPENGMGSLSFRRNSAFVCRSLLWAACPGWETGGHMKKAPIPGEARLFR